MAQNSDYILYGSSLFTFNKQFTSYEVTRAWTWTLLTQRTFKCVTSTFCVVLKLDITLRSNWSSKLTKGNQLLTLNKFKHMLSLELKKSFCSISVTLKIRQKLIHDWKLWAHFTIRWRSISFWKLFHRQFWSFYIL